MLGFFFDCPVARPANGDAIARPAAPDKIRNSLRVVLLI